ncbi:hypothetical protein GCM10025791_00870 [Halioxenophilus aromaticivorans]|uniref:Energy-coupling factor ABC transporter permease n=1 Tax=Halioxenophilus aromaticivorans TaxID=1306992 RepID=A0AAV3TVS1_9ALTE
MRERSLLWIGYWIVISFIWLLRIPAAQSFSVHLCGLTAAVFIFGWPLTVILGAMAVVVNQLLEPMPWYTLSSQMLLAVLIPASIAYGVRRLVLALPVNNLFVYLLGGGFFGSMATTAASALTILALFWALDVWSLRVVLQDNLWLFAVSMFPEGFMGGAVLTTITVLWPELVKNYDDERYLSDR